MKTALLNKLRSKLEGELQKVAKIVSTTGITPNALTASSVLVSLLGYLAVVLTGLGVLLAVAIAISGFMDVLDGSLARLTGKASKKGAFLDSVADRVCEVVFALSLVELGLDSRLVLAFLASSTAVSYMRARGESLGLQMSGVGLMERAERLVALITVALLVDYNMQVATLLLGVSTVLTALTAVQRFLYVWRNL